MPDELSRKEPWFLLTPIYEAMPIQIQFTGKTDAKDVRSSEKKTCREKIENVFCQIMEFLEFSICPRSTVDIGLDDGHILP